MERTRKRRIAATLTVLGTVAVSTYQRRFKVWNGTASAFGPISKRVEGGKRKGVGEKEKNRPPHCHPVIISGSQYAARANSMYGTNSSNCSGERGTTPPPIVLGDCQKDGRVSGSVRLRSPERGSCMVSVSKGKTGKS